MRQYVIWRLSIASSLSLPALIATTMLTAEGRLHSERCDVPRGKLVFCALSKTQPRLLVNSKRRSGHIHRTGAAYGDTVDTAKPRQMEIRTYER